MLDRLIKISLCLCIFICGSSVFANSLNSVEIKTNSNSSKIILDTNKKFAVNKSKISENEIQIELKNTNVTENIKTQSDKSFEKVSISIMQNGKNAYVNLKGQNASKYDIVFAGDNSTVPVNSKSKNIYFTLLAAIMVFITSCTFKQIKEYNNNRKEKLRKEFGFESIKQEKSTINKKQLESIKSLRAKSENTRNTTIHTQSMPQFASNSKMSIPKELKSNNRNILSLKEFKKVANL